MNKRITAVFLILILLGVTFLPGCWSRREIEDLAIVTLIGLDKIDQNGKEVWRLSAKVMQPQEAGSGGSASPGGGQPSGPGKEILFAGTGATMQEAMRNLMLRTPRLMFMGYITSFIIGQRAAREGVSQIADIILRYREFRLRSFVMVTQGEALDVLRATPEVDNTLATEIQGLAENKVKRMGVACPINWNMFMQDLLCPDKDPVAIRVYTVKPKEDPNTPVDRAVVLNGLAVFRGDKLVGWLDPSETSGYIALCGLNNGLLPVAVVEDGKAFTYLVGKVTKKIEPEVDGNQILYHIRIKCYGQVDEVDGMSLTDEQTRYIESCVEGKVKACVMQTVAKSKQLDADFLGLTQTLHKKNLPAWQQLGEGWRESLQQAKVDVHVDAKVLLTGKSSRNLQIKKE